MAPSELEAPTLDQIRAAQERLRGIVFETPLLRLNWEPPAGIGASDATGASGASAASTAPAGTAAPEIYLKLENLQPIGSFKLRGAANAMLQAERARLAAGVYTASAGNMAQGVAWSARHLGVAATAIVPEHAPSTKLDAIVRLGGTVVKIPWERWWQVIREHTYPGMPGLFVHPVSDTQVMAGNGTIALEVLARLPDVDAILIPWGGGGLACGIASALRALRPEAAVYACELAGAAPLAAALAAGSPQTVDYQPTFVDGIGGKSLLPEMWPLARRLLTGAKAAPLADIASAVRLLAERHRVIAEGAGAAALAVAVASLMPATIPPSTPTALINPITDASGQPARKIVCIVSGGNIDAAKLAVILTGGLP